MRQRWAVLAAASVIVFSFVAEAGDAGARDWYQDAADAERASCVDVEPIRGTPVVAWRKKLDEGVVAAPVTWDGTVFALSADKLDHQVLTALDARTGDVRGRVVRFKRPVGRAELAVWEGIVVVVEPTLVEAYSFRGSGLKPIWRREGAAFGPPCMSRGLLLVADFDEKNPQTQHFIGTIDGKDLLTSPHCFGGAAAVFPRPFGDVVVGLSLDTVVRADGRWAVVQSAVLAAGPPPNLAFGAPGLKGLRPQARGDEDFGVCETTSSDRAASWRGVVHVAPARDAADRGGQWLFLTGADVKAADGTTCRMCHFRPGERAGLYPSIVRPAVRDDHAFTFDDKGNLLEIQGDGTYRTLLAAGEAPKGALLGTPSIARNVIHLGNWAVDLDTRRVLWIAPLEGAFDKPILPAVPTGDGLVLYRTESRELVCFADGAAAAPSAAAAAPTVAGPRAPTAPKAGDGVLLRDGRQIPGVAAIQGDDVVVTPASGEPRKFPVKDVLVAESRGQVLLRGAESDVHRVWRDALRAAYVARLESLFATALEFEAPGKAREMIERARAWGMSEARAGEFSAKLAGRREAASLDLKLVGFGRAEAAANDAQYAEVLEGAKWCGARGFPASGGALLRLAAQVAPHRPEAVNAAAALVPPEFPYPGDGARWMTWSPYLAAADARFLAKDDPAWARAAKPPWNEDSIALRTPNLLLFSRCRYATIVGPCLSRGESAVRALHVLLGEKDVPCGSDDERLDVRLHRDRADYLAEAADSFMEWSVGYFSPGENVTRFYVPGKDDVDQPLGRELFTTLSHELTHHYVELRWMPRHGGSSRKRSMTPGFWVVEGIARFVEDQIVDADTRGLSFGDATVRSIDAAAQLSAQGRLLPMEWFCDADQNDFRRLPPESKVEVRLTRTLAAYRLSQINVFYEQAGSLVFFLWNRRGEGGRAALVEYLRRHYAGSLRSSSWKSLGFASAAELETEFRAWLASLPK